jgi:acetyltransferase-like isoleucine patch superfamily enzyme
VGFNDFILNIKRGEKPHYRFLKGVLKAVIRPTPPRIPRFIKPLLRVIYELHFGLIGLGRTIIVVLYRHPVFQARCATVGKNVVIDKMPFISGHVDVHVGNNVWLGGLTILSGASQERPQFIIRDNAEIGWNVVVSVSQEVLIEEYARVSYDCRISDNDGHPREADLRAAHKPIHARDIRPVRICRYAWVGNGTHIMKGVTIGEGAIIGANSVVISDIPPYCLALGNPAEVYFKNVGRPAKKKVPADLHSEGASR